MSPKSFQPKYFHDLRVPEGIRLVGYAALLHFFDIKAPLRGYPSCVSDQFSKASKPKLEDNFQIYSKRYWPGDRIQDHLEFAFRHEIMNFLCLSQILKKIPIKNIEEMLAEKPTGIYARRIWFLFEYINQRKLDVEDLKAVTVQPLLDPKKYITNSNGPVSKRHRIRNNLLGNRNFCPVIQRTDKISSAIEQKFDEKAKDIISQVSRSLIMRAASFILLADTQASFAIEGEKAPRSRIERWLKAVASAGRNKLDLDELIRLHQQLITDSRFTTIGIREDEVFLGERDENNFPIPEFIGAKQTDLPTLLTGFFHALETLAESDVNPVLQAAAFAFGFVYIHPHDDGNGRIHRFILHHILAKRGYTPKEVIFPISSVLLERIEDYRSVLTNHSTPLMDCIEWEPTEKGNVRILNETIDLYRYFDCTEAVEFIFECVEHTIKYSIPSELEYLKRYDKAISGIEMIVEMPNERTKRLIHYIKENGGKLGKKRREGEFALLTDKELNEIEDIVNLCFPHIG
ncbi:Fic/DOC family protein [Pseudobacteriovorax antillogorgiicola]|uniref:Fic/DOC family protein n=2 Tax=Pseudobacteriovorax antillogorgiicola TaxID=1513793 RepID=A0A1Y6BW12_9BACT|nr:Fic/DOC family protein [Pseudobacteriovorax antillogorgiicola]SMF22887.1 Fic/DOC family protein [Pseudobacteriovorax antillogorgiicola]